MTISPDGRIEAVNALHVQDQKRLRNWCAECLKAWPCPTKRAADGTP